MNDNVITFLANLRHDIRNNESVEVGSGIFKGQELVDVAITLAAAPDLLNVLCSLVKAHGARTSWASEDLWEQARAAIAKATVGQ